MSNLKIKLCELNNGDIGSFKSMFHLTASQRNDDWEIITFGAADLCIYSFESEKSISAWQSHTPTDGMSVLFSTNLDVDVAVDIVLKKPLRIKNFSETLNTAAKQIHLATRQKNHSAEEIALQDIYAADNADATNEIKEEKSSIIKSVANLLSRRQSPHPDLPSLNFVLPEQSEIQTDLILDPITLKQSLKLPLASRDDNVLIDSILTNLIPMNRCIIPVTTRQKLLEIYRKSTFQLMRGWENRAQQLKSLSQDEYSETVQAFALLLAELATGYKIVLVEAYQQGEHPKSKESFLLVINRVAEYSSLTILHAYCFLRTTQAEVINTLHQLYSYCEAAQVLNGQVSTKEDQASLSFSTIYNQIILTAIADPLRLTKIDILNLYRLMAKYTKKITLSLLSEEQKQSDNGSLMGGLFCLDLASDKLPISLEKTSSEERQPSNIRLLNTHAALISIERLFQLATGSTDDVYSSEIVLLKKIIPHLNNSYEREFERIPSKNDVYIHLVKDLIDIYSALHSSPTEFNTKWNIHNRGLGGLMVSASDMSYSQLDVGDFYAVFEEHDSPLLATVRWLRLEHDDVVMGLELLRGAPIAIHYFLENEPEKLPALLLRNKKQADTLITSKGSLNIDEAIEITEDDKTYIISIDAVINNTSNYDHFSFTKI